MQLTSADRIRSATDVPSALFALVEALDRIELRVEELGLAAASAPTTALRRDDGASADHVHHPRLFDSCG